MRPAAIASRRRRRPQMVQHRRDQGLGPRRRTALRTVGHDVQGRYRQGPARSARMDDDALSNRSSGPSQRQEPPMSERRRQDATARRTAARRASIRPRTAAGRIRPSRAADREERDFGGAETLRGCSTEKGRDRSKQDRRGFFRSGHAVAIGRISPVACGNACRHNVLTPMRQDKPGGGERFSAVAGKARIRHLGAPKGEETCI